MPQTLMQLKRIVVFGGQPDSFTIYRSPLIRALLMRGYEVTAAAGSHDDAVVATLRSWGVPFECVPLSRAGTNPFRDLRSLWSIFRMLRRVRPAIVLAYQPKPVVYGLAAGWLARVPHRCAMITGLGYAFVESPELKRRFLRFASLALYRTTLRFADLIIFQNEQDKEFFARRGLLRDNQVALRVNGSGVDVDRFPAAPLPPLPVKFLMIARLLWDKGVREFVEAARLVKSRHPTAEFHLVGPLDPNPSSVSMNDIQRWVKEGALQYDGSVRDVRPYLRSCHVFVLPTFYREGVPLSLLEAMSTGRAIVTTDTPGCRDTVVEGENGFLVPPRNSAALADALQKFLDDPDLIARMGALGRARAVRLFDARDVSRAIVEAISSLPPTRR